MFSTTLGIGPWGEYQHNFLEFCARSNHSNVHTLILYNVKYQHEFSLKIDWKYLWCNVDTAGTRID